MQPIRVLIVEDDQSWREVLSFYLEQRGLEVMEAADGEEGLARARRDRPDLILLDLMMPVLDGWGMMEAVRADPSLASIPVVAFSALDHGGIRARLQNSGFLTFLPKPISLRRINEGIRIALAAFNGGSTWIDAPYDVRTMEHEVRLV